ncbi:MAG: 6-hydroxymethylpterin diphosphokinase MptE-like protein [Methanocellales archaeon]
MNFESWEPIYKLILKDFGYSREKDEYAALLISKLISDFKLDRLKELIEGRDVVICGKSKKLEEEIKEVDLEGKVVIAADGATSILLKHEIYPHIIVSDLDGNMDDIFEANRKGAIIVVHAHGDNIDKLKRFVPELRNAIATTQSKPLNNVYNFGGFTDGDRAAFLAKSMGASSIILLGFDFDDKEVSEVKRKKLQWAKKLIDEYIIKI